MRKEKKSSTASWHGGKGSSIRTMQVNKKTFDTNWDKIFKKVKPDSDKKV